MSDMIDRMNTAYRLAEWYRRGTLAWIVLLDQLVERGFYAVERKGDEVIAWHTGIRFSL